MGYYTDYTLNTTSWDEDREEIEETLNEISGYNIKT